MKLWLRNLILRWLGLADHQARLLDLERHFVTKRDEEGMPTETWRTSLSTNAKS
jgi:hypothetical protein